MALTTLVGEKKDDPTFPAYQSLVVSKFPKFRDAGRRRRIEGTECFPEMSTSAHFRVRGPGEVEFIAKVEKVAKVVGRWCVYLRK